MLNISHKSNDLYIYQCWSINIVVKKNVKNHGDLYRQVLKNCHSKYRSFFIYLGQNSIVLNTERGMLIYITVASNRDSIHIMGLGQCKIMLFKISPCHRIFTLWKSVIFSKIKKLHKIEFAAFSLLKYNMVFISVHLVN